ncbi:unnamed protein product [Leuciscus chuanchicus]
MSPLDVLQIVLNTIAEARALSARRLYALEWKVFSTWCAAKNMSPDTCSIPTSLNHAPLATYTHHPTQAGEPSPDIQHQPLLTLYLLGQDRSKPPVRCVGL